MASLKKFDLLSRQEVGEVAVTDAFLKGCAPAQLVKDYIIALRANERQWSASTKGRSEVSHSTKKPFAQKGTGNARQGSLAAPQFRGGGTVFGPKPKFDQHVRINRKERRLAIRHLLAEKMANQDVVVLDDLSLAKLEKPSTKTVVAFLRQHQLVGRRILFVGKGASESHHQGLTLRENGADRCEEFLKSVRNIPRTSFVLASQVNGYNVIAAQKIVISHAALEELQSLLG